LHADAVRVKAIFPPTAPVVVWPTAACLVTATRVVEMVPEGTRTAAPEPLHRVVATAAPEMAAVTAEAAQVVEAAAVERTARAAQTARVAQTERVA
jgi:hypothetical protein